MVEYALRIQYYERVLNIKVNPFPGLLPAETPTGAPDPGNQIEEESTDGQWVPWMTDSESSQDGKEPWLPWSCREQRG